MNAMRICVFSPGGGGKTHLAGTFAKAGKLAIADADDDGVDTLLGWRFRQANPWFDPSMVEYEKFHEDEDEFGVPTGDPKAFWKLLRWINTQIKSKEVKTIVIDSLTTVSEIAINAGMRANLAKRRSQTWNDRSTLHMLLPTMSDFGGEMRAMAQLLKRLRKASDAGKHVIVTAHVREQRSDTGALLWREPLITGDKMRAQFANFFSDVWYIDVRTQPNNADPQRVLVTDTTAGLKGVKSRLGVPSLVDPSYEKIVTELKKKYPSVPSAPSQQQRTSPPVAKPTP